MADPLSVTAGIIAIVTATIQSTSALYETIESFKTYPKRVGELKNQLLALTEVLASLQELARQDDTICALLEYPLRQCCRACEDFKTLLEDCRQHARTGRPSLSEWMRLRYRNGDIVSFMESLAMYKSTIGIAVADANLRTSKVTLGVLNEYKTEVDTTARQLQGYFEELRGRLDGLTTSTSSQATPSSMSLDRMLQEKNSLESCLQICRQFQADLDQMQFQLARENQSAEPANLLTTVSNQDMTLAYAITLSSLKACGLEIADAVTKLTLHQEKARGRLMEGSAAHPQDPTDTQVEVQRLRHELDSVNQLLDVCKSASSRATSDRVHVIQNITVGDHSQQFCVSTVGDLFKIKGATAGHGSFQFFGSMASEPLQEIARMHAGRHASNARNATAAVAEVHSISGNGGSSAT